MSRPQKPDLYLDTYDRHVDTLIQLKRVTESRDRWRILACGFGGAAVGESLARHFGQDTAVVATLILSPFVVWVALGYPRPRWLRPNREPAP